MRYGETWRAQRLYRDPRQGRLAGVCAGVAAYVGCNAALVRVLAIVALFWFGPLTLVAYLVLGVMLPARPDTPYDGDTDEDYLHAPGRSSAGTFRDLHQRSCELDMKLQHMEGCVTSNRYDLDRQFRDLEH